MPTFNLTIEDWIPVEYLNGQIYEISLNRLFRESLQIRRLVGKPVEVASIYRLLIAISARCLKLTKQRQLQEWTDYWMNLGKAMEACSSYIVDQSHLFDLYDRDKPFMQHSGLDYGNKLPNVLIYDCAQGNNAVFLDGTIESGGLEISSAEAARALLSNLSFGGSHPDKSNPLALPGQATMYAGPLCARLIVLLEGKNLAETLLLNFGRIQDPGMYEGKNGLSWERDRPSHPGDRPWNSMLDLYTRQTRFIRLTPSDDGSKCVGVALHMGEGIQGEEQDPMIPQYFASDKKFKDLRLDTGKAMWRNLHVLLNCRQSQEKSRPIQAIELLAARKMRVDDLRVKVRIIGVAGSAQGPKTEMWRDESMPFNLDLISESKEESRHFVALERCLNLAEEEAKKLRARLSGFAEAYLSWENPNPNPEDVKKLVEELCPNLIEYWAELAKDGEQLALQVDEQHWIKQVQFSQDNAYRQALAKIPDNARKYQAMANSFSKKGKQKKS